MGVRWCKNWSPLGDGVAELELVHKGHREGISQETSHTVKGHELVSL